MIKVACPICGLVKDDRSKVEWPTHPFCTARCRTIDLGRWLGGKYRIEPETDGEGPASSDNEDYVP